MMLMSLSTGCAYVTDKEYDDRLSRGDDAADDCVEFQLFYADADADGFGNLLNPIEACAIGDGMSTNSDDCDDTDDTKYPGAVWSADADGDGYGDESDQMESCEPEAGYTGTSGDCDDDNAAVNPDAVEDCATALDDDCSGDLNQVDALGCSDFYADADEDTFGGEDSACLCEATDDFPAAEPLDCDDTDASVSPDAEEICNDGVDNDCDGAANGCGLSAELDRSDSAIRFAGGTGAGLGSRLHYSEDIDGDGDADLLMGGYRQSELGLVSGPVLDGAATATLTGSPDDWFSRDIATGDLNDDGVTDLILGAPRASFASRAQGGIASVYWGPVSADRDLNDHDAEIWGPDGNAYLGRNLAVGEVTGDGVADLIVGALDAKAAGIRVGMVAIVAGPVDTELMDTVVFSDTDARIYGISEGDKLGVEVAVSGDWTGDGIDDVIVGSRFANANKGGIYGFASGATLSGDLSAADADLIITGVGLNSRTGETIEFASDVDGDGLDDLLVSAPHRNLEGVKRGAAYVITEPIDGEITTVALVELQGLLDDGYFGQSLTVLGDVDGSGVGIAVGAPNAGNGRAFMFGGGLSGVYTSDDAIGMVRGAEFSGGVGSALIGNIDYDADGLLDLIVGADGNGLGDGEVVVFLGGGL
jgi:hypothetical protein